MERDFWLEKWKENDIRFHQSKYHPQLEKFGTRFREGTILVPLCGKTLDMLYLSSHGHDVIGVELSPIACRDFFTENGLTFTETQMDEFIVFESESIQIWCGDYFKLPQHLWQKITGIYDRAAVVALPVELRIKYAAEIFSRLPQAHLEILLVSFEYPADSAKGPPFSVEESEIQTLYSPMKIEKIHSESQMLKGNEVKEVVYWMTK